MAHADEGEQPVPKRRKVVNELHQTEKDYVTSLQALSWCFLKPLSGKEQAVGSEIFAELAALEPLVETIKSIHVVFLQDIKKAITAAPLPAVALIGPPFLQMANYLKTYKHYVGHYQKLVPLLAARKNDAALAELLEGLKTKECRGHGLKDFLIMPIQRIPRYNMLIADLVKHTEAEHEDHGPLTQAQQLILSIAEAVENTSVLAENTSKMMALATNLVYSRIPKIKLIESHRRLLWDLEKVTTALADGNTTGRFHLYVFNDLLLFTDGSPEEAVCTLFFPQDVVHWSAKDTQGGQGVMEIETARGLMYITLPSKNLQDLEGVLDVKELDERLTVPVSPNVERVGSSADIGVGPKKKRRGSILGSLSGKFGKKTSPGKVGRVNSETDLTSGVGGAAVVRKLSNDSLSRSSDTLASPRDSSRSPLTRGDGERPALKRTYSVNDADRKGH